MAGSQSLFDTLSGAFGHGVDRPGLESFVANSQAINGLRSAQTEEAINNGQAQRDEMQARETLESTIAGTLGSDGKPIFNPSQARMAAQAFIASHGGKIGDAINAITEMQKAHNTTVASDPNKLNTPEATAAVQGNTNNINPTEAVSNEYTVKPGMTAPVQQTPLGAAEANEHTAKAKAAAASGGAFNPDAIAFGAYMLYKTGKMPALGMGAGPARGQIISGASQLAQQEAKQPGSTANPAYDEAIANGQDFTAAGKALNSAAAGPVSTQTRALNNVVGHLGLMENLFSNLQNGDMQAVNSMRAAWKKAFGSEIPVDIQTAANVIGPELTKILTSTGAGTGPEREHFAETAGNLANAPEQTGGAIGTLKGMLGRQAADLAFSYHGATGRGDFATRYLQPDVIKYLELGAEGQQSGSSATPTPTPGPAAAPHTSAPVKITNDTDWAKLAPGTHFIGPDGHIRIK